VRKERTAPATNSLTAERENVRRMRQAFPETATKSLHPVGEVREDDDVKYMDKNERFAEQ